MNQHLTRDMKNNELSETINECKRSSNKVVAMSSVNSISIWHVRLGHAPSNVLFKAVNSGDCNKEIEVCEMCPLSKQKRLPFPNSKDQVLMHLN